MHRQRHFYCSIAVFYDSKASYSIMESPYSPDRISSSATAQKWEHVSLCTKCKSEDYVCWEVMYTLGPLRNRLSIAHYDNGGVTIMPPLRICATSLPLINDV